MKGNASGDLLEIFSIRLPDHQDFLKMSAKVTPFSKISARRIAYFILFLTFVTFLYYQTRVIMESSALGFGRSYEEAIKRQASRKKIMEQYCQTNSYEKEPRVSRENLGYIIVNDEYKFMYCTIPKVGTTTWKRVFAELRGLRRNVKVHRWNLWKRLYQYSEEERNIRLQTYFKFLFVRDPLKRLLSAYKNKFIGSNPGVSSFARMHIIKEYRPKDLNKNNNWVSFSEFIQYFSEDRARNQHWRQYEKLCHPCAVNYSFIGHLETLEDDAHLLLKMAGIDDRVSFPPVHKSTSSSEILDYYSQVPVEYITRLGELYRSDFEMFGYDFPGDLQTLIKNSSSNC